MQQSDPSNKSMKEEIISAESELEERRARTGAKARGNVE